jgi:ketosteroid isomerase-like protein
MPKAIAREIDAQVWLPMLAASDAFDAAGFLAMQSPDLVRVSIDTNEVYGLEHYRSELTAGFARARQRGIKRRSDLRFLTRASSGDLARDTGIFRSEVVLASGETRVRYTAFDMVLRKEQGRWKILVDQDTARGGVITEQDYLKGTPLLRTGPNAS